MPRSFSNVSVVGFHPFSNTKVAHKRITEVCHVVVPTSSKRAIDPNDVPCLNTNANLVSQASFLGKLVTRKDWPVVLASEISAITSDKTVGTTVTLESIIPHYLEGRIDNQANEKHAGRKQMQ